MEEETQTIFQDAPGWPDDLWAMHTKFGFREAVDKLTPRGKSDYLDFRIGCLYEELEELEDAVDKKDAEKCVDALIDLCVFAIGTLDVFRVNAQEAWDRVHRANMNKLHGVNPNRPNPFGLPDLFKPEGWVGPTHENNVGMFPELLNHDTE